jgi:hypothetical protein
VNDIAIQTFKLVEKMNEKTIEIDNKLTEMMTRQTTAEKHIFKLARSLTTHEVIAQMAWLGGLDWENKKFKYPNNESYEDLAARVRACQNVRKGVEGDYPQYVTKKE